MFIRFIRKLKFLWCYSQDIWCSTVYHGAVAQVGRALFLQNRGRGIVARQLHYEGVKYDWMVE